MSDVLQDFRYAVRSLAKDRRFAWLSILALGLGIGSATVMFSAIYGVIVDTFPYRNADRITSFAFHDTTQPGEYGREYLALSEFLDLREQNHVFEDMNAGFGRSANPKFVFTDRNSTIQVGGGYLSANSPQFFGVPPLLGRWSTPEDTKPGAAPVFLMSHKLWTERFGRDPGILGKTFVLNGVTRTLVGIMPPRFRPGWVEVWVLFPLDRGQIAADPEFKEARGWPMARLKPGVSLKAAAADIDLVAHRLAKVHPEMYPKKFRVTVRSLSDRVLGPFKRLIYPLAAAVGLLLLIACTNAANLLLARATIRRREVAIRLAMGARQSRIAAQFLAESLVLAAAGCVAGCLFAYGGIRAMVPLIPYNFFPQEAVIELNPKVLLFALATAALTTLVCGLAPALHGLGGNVQPGLLAANKGTSTDFGHGKLRSALVVAEVALSIVLLVGAGLLMRTFFAVMHVDLGFNPDKILAASVSFPNGGYDDAQQRQFFERALERVQALPGVAAAAQAIAYPLYQGASSEITIPGRAHSERWNSALEMCSDGYFQTLQLPLLRGRVFTRNEVEGERRVAVVNQTFARKYFGAEDPIGRTVKFNEFDQYPITPHNAYFEIIGIVGDTRNQGLQDPSLPEAYLPTTIAGGGGQTLLVRTSVDPAAVLPAVLRAVWSLDSRVSLGDEGTLTSILQRDDYGLPRFQFAVMSGFAGIGMLLVVIGVFSVMAYTVSLRTQEIGVRMALGAQRVDVVRMVLRNGLSLISAGIAVGLLGSFGLTRYMRSRIWGVSVTDPWTYVAVIACVLAVGLAACLSPARRASRVDPMVALRYE